MAEKKAWTWLKQAIRGLGAVATVGAAVLALGWMLDDVYAGGGEWARLARWLLSMLVLSLAVVPLTKRTLRSERWDEALRWVAVCLWQGVRLGLVCLLILPALLMAVWLTPGGMI